MPHVEISCFPGRTEEVKQECADKVAQLVAGTLGCKITSVSVAIKEVHPDDWKKLYDEKIMADQEVLYIKPGYEA
jgi:4-oxalocrotonate tautomerase